MHRPTYFRRPGGLMRCCLDSLDSHMVTRMAAGEGPPEDGDTNTTQCCQMPLVHRDGAWEWAKPRKAPWSDPLGGAEEQVAQARAEQEARVEEVAR